MIPQLFVESIDLGDGRNITIETGRLAKQADGSVVVRIGNCYFRNSSICKKSKSSRFFTLTVDYRENLLQQDVSLAVSSKEKQDQVITSINNAFSRPCFALFPSDYHAEVQVMIQLVSMMM
jgi:polyribonucleotide nucleotidyltransferase